MSFTDDDLKRLKDGIAGPDDAWFDGYSVRTIKALIARLEAAESMVKTDDVVMRQDGASIDSFMGRLKKFEAREKQYRNALGKITRLAHVYLDPNGCIDSLSCPACIAEDALTSPRR